MKRGHEPERFVLHSKITATTPRFTNAGYLPFLSANFSASPSPFMDLPKLKSGQRYTLPRPVASADALLLAQLGAREKAAGQLLAIVTADATDAQRLIDEMAFFAPDLRCALFPDWETLPYDTFSPHQDLISERLATLWRISQRDKDNGADVIIVPAVSDEDAKTKFPKGWDAKKPYLRVTPQPNK